MSDDNHEKGVEDSIPHTFYFLSLDNVDLFV